MLRNCTPERYAINKERMMRLAEYSRDVLQQLRADTGIAYEQRTAGRCSCSAPAQLDAVQRDVAVLEECGVPFELLNARPARRGRSPAWPSARTADRRAAPAQRRNRRLPSVHHALAERAAAWASISASDIGQTGS